MFFVACDVIYAVCVRIHCNILHICMIYRPTHCSAVFTLQRILPHITHTHTHTRCMHPRVPQDALPVWLGAVVGLQRLYERLLVIESAARRLAEDKDDDEEEGDEDGGAAADEEEEEGGGDDDDDGADLVDEAQAEISRSLRARRRGQRAALGLRSDSVVEEGEGDAAAAGSADASSEYSSIFMEPPSAESPLDDVDHIARIAEALEAMARRPGSAALQQMLPADTAAGLSAMVAAHVAGRRAAQ